MSADEAAKRERARLDLEALQCLFRVFPICVKGLRAMDRDARG